MQAGRNATYGQTKDWAKYELLCTKKNLRFSPTNSLCNIFATIHATHTVTIKN